MGLNNVEECHSWLLMRDRKLCTGRTEEVLGEEESMSNNWSMPAGHLVEADGENETDNPARVLKNRI
jgi:hypothetical protein